MLVSGPSVSLLIICFELRKIDVRAISNKAQLGCKLLDAFWYLSRRVEGVEGKGKEILGVHV